MTILGGIEHFWGPLVGAAALVLLNQQITSYTEYWSFVLGLILLVLLFVFPGGIVGGIDRRLSLASPSRLAGAPCLKCAASANPSAAFAPWPRSISR